MCECENSEHTPTCAREAARCNPGSWSCMGQLGPAQQLFVPQCPSVGALKKQQGQSCWVRMERVGLGPRGLPGGGGAWAAQLLLLQGRDSSWVQSLGQPGPPLGDLEQQRHREGMRMSG